MDFGIPQHRERIFILGTPGGSGIRKVFLERKNERKDTELQGQQANTITRRYQQSQAIGTYIAERKLTQIENLHFDRSQQNRIYGTGGIAPTIHRKTGGDQVTKIGIPVRQVDGRGKNANGRRFKTPDEPSFTLQSSQRQGVYDGMDIRYITPLECEKLMGWESNWTKYGIDEKGNTIELSDTQRYNLIGNGVVPQVVREIVRYLILQKNDVCDISDGEVDE